MTTGPPTRRATRVDVALAAGSFGGGLLLLSLGTYRSVNPAAHFPTALFALPLAATCVAVGLRRAATRTSLALGTAGVLADLAIGGSLGTLLVYTQVLYDACVYGSARTWRWLLRSSVALAVLGALAGVLAARAWYGVSVGVVVVLVTLLPVLTGISVRQYRDQAATARAQAEQTARLAELGRRQAVLAERHRMARELHDVVANHLSAVAIHATAALSVSGLDAEQVRQALRVIRENSVQGLGELRQMIGLLREPAAGPVPSEPAAGPAPSEPAEPAIRVGLADLDRLLDRSRSAGLAVTARTTGTPRELPVGVDLAAYRILQESLTNALKHGQGPVDLAVDYRADAVALSVLNPIPGAAGGDGVPGAGAGLIGMRERAALVDGWFTAGPDGDRWRVAAELPTGRVR
ncbi:sensor histidine kinase [Plantactinospora siamensis]|uniref:histidine kinase n=1 Tax=Plantactinospora siamensis TaxID=555372 RepID=A0ABV6P151_9ACTN